MTKIIRIDAELSTHAGCGGTLGMSSDAPAYIITLQGLETSIPGAEMVCLKCGGLIRSQEQVDVA